MQLQGGLLGFPQLADVGDLGQPPRGRLIEMIERGEGAAVEQAGFHIRKGAFHLPFRLGPPGSAGHRPEAVVGGERQEPRVVDRHVVLVASHDDLHIVIQAGGCHAPQMLEGPQVLAQGGRHVLGLDEAEVLPPRVAQDVLRRHASCSLIVPMG